MPALVGVIPSWPPRTPPYNGLSEGERGPTGGFPVVSIYYILIKHTAETTTIRCRPWFREPTTIRCRSDLGTHSGTHHH